MQKVLLAFIFIEPILKLLLLLKQTVYLSSLTFSTSFLEHKIFESELDWAKRIKLHMLAMGLDFASSFIVSLLYASVVYYGLMTWIMEVPARMFFSRHIPSIEKEPSMFGDLLSLFNFSCFEGLLRLIIFLPSLVAKKYLFELPKDQENGTGLEVMKIFILAMLALNGLFKPVFVVFYHLMPSIWFLSSLASGLLILNVFYFGIYFLHRQCPNPSGGFGERIAAMAQTSGFNPKNVFIDTGTTSLPNAYQFTGFYGLYNHIVLTKGLINFLSIDQLVAVFAHELGHWFFSHFWQAGMLMLVNEFLLIAVLAYLARPSLYKAFGWNTVKGSRVPWLVMFLSVSILIIPIEILMSYSSMALTHKNEYQADSYCAEVNLAGAMIEAMWRFMKIDKEQSDPIVSWLTRSHPTCEERIKALGGTI